MFLRIGICVRQRMLVADHVQQRQAFNWARVGEDARKDAVITDIMAMTYERNFGRSRHRMMKVHSMLMRSPPAIRDLLERSSGLVSD